METNLGLDFSQRMAAFLITVVCFFSLPVLGHPQGNAFAAEVTLAWDANSESDLDGYRLYYESEFDIELYKGIDATEGESPITIYLEDLADQSEPTYTVSGLEDNRFYFFTLTAFNADGIESDFSDEVAVFVDAADSNAEVQQNKGSSCFISGVIGF